MDPHDSQLGRFAFGLILTGFFLFLTVSLLSYSPFDPPAPLLYTGSNTEHIKNLCGRIGALLSGQLFDFCGIGVWFCTAAFFFRLFSYFHIGESRSPILQTIGFFMMLAAVCGAAAFYLPNITTGTIYGSGGRLGALLRTELNDWFAPLGSSVFLISLFLTGTILACEWRFLRLLFFVTGILTISEILKSMFAPLGRKIFRSASRPVQNPVQNPVQTKRTVPETTSEFALAGYDSPDSILDTADDLISRISDKIKESPDSAGSNNPDSVSTSSVSTGSVNVDSDSTGPDSTGPDNAGEVSDSPQSASPAKKPQLSAEPAAESSPESAPDSPSESVQPAEKQTGGSADGDLTPLPVHSYELPPMGLLEEGLPCDKTLIEEKTRQTSEKLEKVFADYGFHIQVVGHQSGPVLTLYEIALDAGTRIPQIRSLASSDDLAVAMSVQSVRIVAPLPGKNTIGVEIPNRDRQLVRLRDVMTAGEESASQMAIPLYLGQDVKGNPLIADMAKLPHLLIAGRTGTGKSVCLNSIILSILMTRSPDEVRLLLIDPKVVEFAPYKTIPHLLFPTVTDMSDAEKILGWAVNKMEERYRQLARAGVRQLSEYNRLTEAQLRARTQPESEEEWGTIPKKMPYLVIVIDEMSDMMMVAGKEAESHIIRLAQKSRAVGIHLILATQKPTVDVITGQIKSNLPARIAFGVASLTDSRVVLDARGAEQLLGNGDMLFLLPGTSRLIRGQGTYVSNGETESVVSEISTEIPDFDPKIFDVVNEDDVTHHPDRAAKLLQNKDKLYNEAVEYVIQEGRGSTSLLQRRFEIGYGRAARIIDTMAIEGVVGPYNGSQAREVIMTLDQWKALNEPKPETIFKPVIPPSDKPAPQNSRIIEKRLPFAAGPLEESADEPEETPIENPTGEPEEWTSPETESDDDHFDEEITDEDFPNKEVPDENLSDGEYSDEKYSDEDNFDDDNFDDDNLKDEENLEDDTEEKEENIDDWGRAGKIETIYDPGDTGEETEDNESADNKDYEANNEIEAPWDDLPEDSPVPAPESNSDELLPIRPQPTLRELARSRKKKKNKKNKHKKLKWSPKTGQENG